MYRGQEFKAEKQLTNDNISPGAMGRIVAVGSHQNVARCRDGEHVSRVSLHDAGECQPGLLSMEWYPSLFLKFFHQLIFPCRHTCSLETLGTIPTSLLVFVENVFTFLVSLLFMECKLHSGNLSLVATKRLPLKLML